MRLRGCRAVPGCVPGREPVRGNRTPRADPPFRALRGVDGRRTQTTGRTEHTQGWSCRALCAIFLIRHWTFAFSPFWAKTTPFPPWNGFSPVEFAVFPATPGVTATWFGIGLCHIARGRRRLLFFRHILPCTRNSGRWSPLVQGLWNWKQKRTSAQALP